MVMLTGHALQCFFKLIVEMCSAGSSPRAGGDRNSPTSSEHATQSIAACNGNGHTPAALLGRLPNGDTGCPMLEHDSLPSTTSEAPSGSSEDRGVRMNGASHLVGCSESPMLIFSHGILPVYLGLPQVSCFQSNLRSPPQTEGPLEREIQHADACVDGSFWLERTGKRFDNPTQAGVWKFSVAVAVSFHAFCAEEGQLGVRASALGRICQRPGGLYATPALHGREYTYSFGEW